MDLKRELEPLTRVATSPPTLMDLVQSRNAQRRSHTIFGTVALIGVLALAAVGIAVVAPGDSGDDASVAAVGPDLPYRQVALSASVTTSDAPFSIDFGSADGSMSSPLEADFIFSLDLEVENTSDHDLELRWLEISAATEPGATRYIGSEARFCEGPQSRVCDASPDQLVTVLHPGALWDVEILVDLAQLTPGTYSGTLALTWSTGGDPPREATVPFRLVVEATDKPPMPLSGGSVPATPSST